MVQNILKSPKKISEQLQERFKKEIREGKYGADEPLPAFGVLADSYGISKSTIHEAFKKLSEEGFLYIKQGKGAFINPDKVERERIRQLQNIAVIAFNIFSPNDNYVIPFFEAMNSTADEKIIELNFHFIQGTSLLAPENTLLKSSITEGNFQGLIIASPIDVEDIRWLTSLKVPFVMTTSKYNLDIPQVSFDNAAAAKLAYKIFKEKGCKKIAAFTGPLIWERENITPYAREIYNSFNDLKKKNGLAVDLFDCEYSYTTAKTKALEVCFAKNDYDGLFFQSDILAKGVLAAYKEKEVKADGIVSINYCDLEEYLADINIKKPLKEMGEKAIELLEKICLKKEIEENNIILNPQIN